MKSPIIFLLAVFLVFGALVVGVVASWAKCAENNAALPEHQAPKPIEPTPLRGAPAGMSVRFLEVQEGWLHSDLTHDVTVLVDQVTHRRYLVVSGAGIVEMPYLDP